MIIYVPLSNYFDNDFFGTYSTLVKARKALEHYFQEDPDIISFENTSNYSYTITTIHNKQYIVEIGYDILDYEFEKGEIVE